MKVDNKTWGKNMKSDAQQSNTEPVTDPKTVPDKSLEPQYGGVLRIANTYVLPPRMGVPGRINVGGIHVQPMVENFFRVDRAGRLVPQLAESWKYDKDGLRLTLPLKKGIKFHDGTDFNAEAAKWNLLKAREYNATLQDLSSVDVVDEYTIVLNVKSYSNHFSTCLAYNGGCILSPTAYKTYGEEYCLLHPVGTGPFKFVSYEPDVKLTVERFDSYWQKGKPYLDRIEMLYVPDMKKAVDMLRHGQVDVVLNINGDSADILKSEEYVVTELPWTMEVLNPDSLNADSPLANKKVRQAIEYAIDRPTIADTIGHGYWRPLTQLATEAVYGYNPTIEGRSYNPDKARQLLAESGYPDGFKTKLIGGEGMDLLKLFTAIQKYLADVGIEAEIEIAEPAIWKQYRASKPWHNAMLLNHYATDPNFTWSVFGFHSSKEYGHISQLRNFDNIVNDMIQARDYDTMAKNTQRLIKHVYDEALVIPIIITTSIAVRSKKVHGLEFHEIHLMKWKPADGWKEK
jgi:peptide/nickel transport system substrate-binding protein